MDQQKTEGHGQGWDVYLTEDGTLTGPASPGVLTTVL